VSRIIPLIATFLVLGLAAEEKIVVVNDYFGMDYRREPVSFDWELAEPAPLAGIGIEGRPFQVVLLEGEPDAARKVRVWTTVDFPFVERTFTDRRGREEVRVGPDVGANRHMRLTLTTDAQVRATRVPPYDVEVADADEGDLDLATVDNGLIRARLPVGGIEFDRPRSAFAVPGPVIAIARADEDFVGDGYLDSIKRVVAVDGEVTRGLIFYENALTYRFDDGSTYAVRVRLFGGEPFVRLVEDFDLGDHSRFVFAYGDWQPDAYFRPRDHDRYGWEAIDGGNPTNDFVTIEGQRALARLVVWSQFNYFGGKQETIALKRADPAAMAAEHKRRIEKWKKRLAKWESKQEAWKANPPEKGIPPKPEEPKPPSLEDVVIDVDGIEMRVPEHATPGGDSTAIGAFYLRPDRWTRAKVNHVDLYLRPEVPGRPITRGVYGLEGSVLRPAMEAWLRGGHREWAIFAVRSGDRDWLTRAHVVEGVWPLDRLNRLPLVWNSDGSPVAPENTVPGDVVVGGAAAAVLKGTRGRSGLQYFNGSNGHIRGTYPKGGWDGEVEETVARGGPDGNVNELVGIAIQPYLGADDATYPSRRAMLPWTHPEALNPFYQGTENMNFNADLYRWVFAKAQPLKRRGHPEADRLLAHGAESFDMALDRYVYPQSGCWEESHGYAAHTVKTVTPLVWNLRDFGFGDYFDDPRFARMVGFFGHVYSPVDLAFGNRVVPPVGDHGLSHADPAGRLGKLLGPFAGSENEEVAVMVGEIGWLVGESGGEVPDGVQPREPEFASRWLQGYGSVLRASAPEAPFVQIVLPGATPWPGGKKRKDEALRHLVLTCPVRDGRIVPGGSVVGPAHRRRSQAGSYRVDGDSLHVEWRLTKGGRRSSKIGGEGTWEVDLRADEGGFAGSFAGSFCGDADVDAEGAVRGGRLRAGESFAVLRAGQSWGHHHADKGSLWFWGRNVHFFGDCSWGAPPGGTYWNPYKQGPRSGTQIEFAGINNWTLPCKYPAPWIADSVYGDGYDYAVARCLYPYNPTLALGEDAPITLSNGYDRRVLFLHPDLLIVRDDIASNCPAIWRLHSYHKQGTEVQGAGAEIAADGGLAADLAIVHPDGLELGSRDAFPEIPPSTGEPSKYAGQPFSSRELHCRLPDGASATWVFAVRDAGAETATSRSLDPEGRVTEVVLGDGTVVLAFLDDEPFTWEGDAWRFAGQAGFVILPQNGEPRTELLRGEVLEPLR